MLILQRKAGESVFIGEEIEVSVLSVDAGRVRLAIQAPKSVAILRSELKSAAAGRRLMRGPRPWRSWTPCASRRRGPAGKPAEYEEPLCTSKANQIIKRPQASYISLRAFFCPVKSVTGTLYR